MDYDAASGAGPDDDPPTGGINSRPPGCVDEVRLVELCYGCGDCVEVCPKNLIELDREGYPYVQRLADCGACGLCADVCTPEAIGFTASTRAGLDLMMLIEA